MKEIERNWMDWEYGVLEFHNPKIGPLKPYFDLVIDSENLSGDIVEFGVWRGASIITTSLIVETFSRKKKVYGIDTFSGFPSYSPEDDFKCFVLLRDQGVITSKHFEQIQLNEKHLRLIGKDTKPSDISSSNDFAGTSFEYVANKLSYLRLEKIAMLLQKDATRLTLSDLPESISLALIDLDLYGGYSSTLPLIWERLQKGGYIYLDEYYSLKFPGPRIAVNQFCAEINITPYKLCSWMDFERWVLIK